MKRLAILLLVASSLEAAASERWKDSTAAFPQYLEGIIAKSIESSDPAPPVFYFDPNWSATNRSWNEQYLNRPNLKGPTAVYDQRAGESFPFAQYGFPVLEQEVEKSKEYEEILKKLTAANGTPPTIVVPNARYSIALDARGNATIVSQDPEGKLVSIRICDIFPWVCEVYRDPTAGE